MSSPKHSSKKADAPVEVRVTQGQQKLRDNLKPLWPFAVEHADADHRCGRAWQCACGPCREIRREIKRFNNLEPNRGSAWMRGFELSQLLQEAAQ